MKFILPQILRDAKTLCWGFIAVSMVSCNSYNALMKSPDSVYKYEEAKSYFEEGKYNKANFLFSNVLAPLKGTTQGEECLFLLGESSYRSKQYDMAATYFSKYAESYPKGAYAELASYKAGMALAKLVPDPRLDQSDTYAAISHFTSFLSKYPTSPLVSEVQQRIFELQDLLVEKQYLSAKLYYDLGSYIGNGLNGNYKACIITAENAIKEYPYTQRRESLSWLIVKAKFDYAKISVESKKPERYADAIDEYYGFLNEFPETKHLDELKKIYKDVPAKYIKSENN